MSSLPCVIKILLGVSKKLLKNRNITFLKVPCFTWKLHFVWYILSMIVENIENKYYLQLAGIIYNFIYKYKIINQKEFMKPKTSAIPSSLQWIPTFLYLPTKKFVLISSNYIQILYHLMNTKLIKLIWKSVGLKILNGNDRNNFQLVN